MATLFQSGLTLIGVVVILFVMDSHLALLTFLALPVIAAGGLAFRIASADAYRLTREKIASITGYLQESLPGSGWSGRSARSRVTSRGSASSTRRTAPRT